jgi:hypothetical protein
MKSEKRQECPQKNGMMLFISAFFLLLVCHPAVAVDEIPVTGEISLDPMTDHLTGESFIITGTTNIMPGNDLLIEISPLNHTRSIKGINTSGSAGRVTIKQGPTGKNTWSYSISSSDLLPDEYRIVVSSYQSDIHDEGIFTIRDSGGPVVSPKKQSTALRSSTGIFAIILCLFCVHLCRWRVQ